MKNILIALAAVALLSTAAIVFVQHNESAELEKLHIHIPHPHIHLPKIHLKINFKALGQCASVLTGAVSNCGAAIDTVGGDITGDIGCVQAIVKAKQCGHIF